MGWTDEDDRLFPQEVKEHGWEVKRKLGIGSTGAVFHAVRSGKAPGEQGEQVAIKAYRIQQPDQSDGRYLYNEVLRQLPLFHPHIIQFRSLIPTSKYLCLVMEYANAGDLFKFTKQTRGLPEAAARFIFQQLILVLQYCHSKEVNMYIRDVKPSNLLLVWNSSGMPLVKVTDFNLAKDVSLKSSPSKTPVGCTMWMSPQAVRNRAKDYDEMVPYGPICDIWSAAVTLYYLLYTKWPFSDKTILEWTIDGSQVAEDNVVYPPKNEHGPVSEDVIDLMRSVFSCGNYKTVEEYDENKGITIENIIAHPWFQKDLPEKAMDMTQQCLVKTVERRQSKAYKDLVKSLCEAAERVGVEQTSRALGTTGLGPKESLAATATRV